MTVIDLDTVMPGSITSDVGELVRSCGRSTWRGARHAVCGRSRESLLFAASGRVGE